MKTNVVMSMVNPSTDALMTKVDSRYGLVVLAARRARQLMTGAEVKAKNQSTKNVTNALEEIVEGKITYEITKDYREENESAENNAPEDEAVKAVDAAEASVRELSEDEAEDADEPDEEDADEENAYEDAGDMEDVEDVANVREE